MLYSMTGYGKAQNTNDQLTITTEIRTLNSKQLDINLKAPTWLKALELDIRNILSEQLQRGKIDAHIDITFNKEITLQLYNTELIKQHYLQLQQLIQHLNIPPSNPYIDATLLREALNTSKPLENKEYEFLTAENKELIRTTVEQCCHHINEFRKQEGTELEKDILHQLNIIQELKTQIAQIEPQRKTKIREKILTHLKEYLDESKINTERFEMELIFYLEKLDINEELVRLSNHLEYFKTICQNGYNMGKKLHFIAQEIGREINTIGSKANDDTLQRLVVEMKENLEKIKEQLNNIL